MKYLGDFHIHTVASNHAYSTLREVVNQASKTGLKYIGITDHGPSMLDGPHFYYFSNMGIIPDFIDGVRIFKGIEANIVSVDGLIDYEPEKMPSLDYVIASFHSAVSPEGLSAEENTKIIEKVVKKKVSVIGHPGNPKFPVMVKEFVALCKENNVAVEINNSSFKIRKGSYEICMEIAEECAAQKADVLFSSDAHIDCAVGIFDKSAEVAFRAGIKPENIINLNESLIEKYLQRG